MENIFDEFKAEEIIEDDSLPPKLMVLDLPEYTKDEILEDSKPIIYETYEEAFDKIKTEIDFVCEMKCSDGSFFWIVNLSEALKNKEKLN